jgi:hypothetical protein
MVTAGLGQIKFGHLSSNVAFATAAAVAFTVSHRGWRDFRIAQ